MKKSNLKKLARKYVRHPAGAAGGMGGQFAPKEGGATHAAVAPPEGKSFQVVGGRIILSSGKQIIPKKKLKDGEITLTREQLLALKKKIVDGPAPTPPKPESKPEPRPGAKMFRVENGRIILSSGKQIIPTKKLKDGEIELTADELKALRKEVVDAPQPKPTAEKPKPQPEPEKPAAQGGRKGAKGSVVEGRDLPDGFPEAGFKTAAAADAWLAERHPGTQFTLDGYIQKSESRTGKPRKMSGFDAEGATLAALTYETLANRCPGAAKEIQTFGAGPTRGALGCAHYEGIKSRGAAEVRHLYLNATNNRGGMKTSAKRKETEIMMREDNWGVIGPLSIMEDIVAHEFGHMVDRHLGTRDPDYWHIHKGVSETSSLSVFRKANANLLSRYAATSTSEAFAEAFASYYMGVNLNHPMVQEVSRLVREM